MKLFYILTISILLSNIAVSQVNMGCLITGEDGSVQVNWGQYTGSDFVSYSILRSDDGVNFINVFDAIDETYTSHFDNGIDANNQIYYYYVNTNISGGTSLPSDTMITIFLETTIVDYEFSIVNLNWNTPYDLSPDDYFEISRTINSSQVNIIPQNLTSHIDTIFVCDTVKYRVTLFSQNYICFSRSNFSELEVSHTHNTDIPVIDNVIMNSDGTISINWQASDEPDIVEYIIYQYNGQPPLLSADTLGIVQVPNTSYNGVISDICNYQNSFEVIAIDSCGNSNVSYLNSAFKMLHLNSIVHDVCNRSNEISWDISGSGISSIEHQVIFASVNGGIAAPIDTLNSSDTAYSHTTIKTDSTYCYFLESYTNAWVKKSSSCEKCIQNSLYELPKDIYLKNVTVVDNQDIEVSFYADIGTATITSYHIFRANDSVGTYILIDSIIPSADTIYYFTDNNVDVANTNYFYRIVVLDECGKVALNSNFGRNILLKGSQTDDVNILLWNDYKTWEALTSNYNIFRSINTNNNFSLIDNTVHPLTTFNDFLSGVNLQGSVFYYYVEAEESTQNNYGFKEKSRSNTILLSLDALIKFPNAFAPKGINNEFKPLFSFINPNYYNMYIYNRWGQLVFESTDPNIGWGGKQNEKYVPPGVYVYYMMYNPTDEEKIEKRGTVTVIY